MREPLFWTFGALAVACAIMCITRRSPVASALYLVVVMFSLAVLFVLLDAQFIAALQVLVYAGAIMVLFLFVIMLLNLGRPGPSDIKGPAGVAAAVLLPGVLLLQLAALGGATPPEAITLPAEALATLQRQEGVVNAVARPLFEEYLIPFEITSLLLLAAIVGAVVLAKRRL
ncbi:MAG TPA: NADH-quinone oxidoreductase subunit J [Gemmatimonadales bacterium]|nr:NADH-quinone oxidoreductase subunit J [Gemmatimonadales bacterium]